MKKTSVTLGFLAVVGTTAAFFLHESASGRLPAKGAANPPPDLVQVMQSLSGKSEVSCDELSSAAEAALAGSSEGAPAWDELLNVAALLARDPGCKLDPTPWFVLISEKSGSSLLRAHAEFHLGIRSQASQKYEDSVAHFAKCREIIANSEKGQSLAALDVSALNWMSNSLSMLGSVEEAVAAGREAIALSLVVNGDKSSSSKTILANQVHLETAAGNHATAANLTSEQLVDRPRTTQEARLFAHNAVVRYQSGIRAGESHESASVALEIAWSDPIVRNTPYAARVGHELVHARKRQKDRWSEGYDLAAELIQFISTNRDRWVAEAPDASVSEQIRSDLRGIAVSCASTLQSINMHNSIEYMNLAYTTIVEHTDNPEEKERVFDAWDRALADYAAGK